MNSAAVFVILMKKYILFWYNYFKNIQDHKTDQSLIRRESKWIRTRRYLKQDQQS